MVMKPNKHVGGGTVKEQFFISNDMFTKWRESKEVLKMANDCVTVASHLLSAVE